MAQAARRRITSEELLQAGWELLQEELSWGPSEHDRTGVVGRLTSAVSLIGATEVVARVNATTGAFYSRWPNQAAFARDLAVFILKKERHEREYLRAVLDEFDAAVRSGHSLPSVIRKTAEKDLDVTTSSAAFAAQMYFWSLCRAEPPLRGLLQEQYESIDGEWKTRFADIIGDLGLRLRPGVSLPDVCTMFSALAEGMAIRRVVDPESATAEVLIASITAIVLAVVDWSGERRTVAEELTAKLEEPREVA